jgi:hypothetical protein
LATIEQLNRRHGRNPVTRILPNQYDVRTKLAREILAELRNRFRGVVFESIVNFNTKLKEGASFGQPITEFAPTSMGAKDFQKLAREIMADDPSAVPAAEILKHVEKLAADADRLLATTATLIDRRAVENARTDRTEPSTTAHQPASKPAGGQTVTPVRQSPAQPASVPIAPLRSDPAAFATVDVGQVRINVNGQANANAGSTRGGNGAYPATSTVQSIDHDRIHQRIETIYGARQEGDVAVFRCLLPNAEEVQLAGDFNDWMPHTTPMRRLSHGEYEARLRLPRGRYRYRLVVDGRWCHDQHNPLIETNDYGELNSVVEMTR